MFLCYVFKRLDVVAEQSVILLKHGFVVGVDKVHDVLNVVFHLLTHAVRLFAEPYQKS